MQVGNGDLTLNEQRSHFALWALLKSPLMVGTDLASIAPEVLDILLAKEVLAVNQDALGVAGDLVWKEGPAEASSMPAVIKFKGPLILLPILTSLHAPCKDWQLLSHLHP